MNSSKITEEINPNSKDINTKNIDQILRIFNSEDSLTIEAVKNILPSLEKLILNVIKCFKNNGKLF